jgi:hypothetical protein
MFDNISFADEVEKVWRCNLCNMELAETDDVEQRKKRHEDFHKDESVGKSGARQRNWTFGTVDWTLKDSTTKTDLYEARFVSEPEWTTNFQHGYNDIELRNYRAGGDYDWSKKKVLKVDDDILHKFLEQEYALYPKDEPPRLDHLTFALNRHLSDKNHGGLFPSDMTVYFMGGNTSIEQFVKTWVSKTNKVIGESLADGYERFENDDEIEKKKRMGGYCDCGPNKKWTAGDGNTYTGRYWCNICRGGNRTSNDEVEIKKEILKEMIEEEKKADEVSKAPHHSWHCPVCKEELQNQWQYHVLCEDCRLPDYYRGDKGARYYEDGKDKIYPTLPKDSHVIVDLSESNHPTSYVDNYDNYEDHKMGHYVDLKTWVAHQKYYEDQIKWWNKGNEEFKEDEHPRDEDGKFTDKGGGSSSDTSDKPIPLPPDYTANDLKWEDESSPRLDKELAKKIFDRIKDEYEKEELIDNALGDYPETLGYESDLVWEDLTDEDQSKIIDHYNAEEELEWEWKMQQGMNVTGWDYKGGKPEKQSVKTLQKWGHQLFGIGLRLSHGRSFEKTKIPTYPKEKPRTVEDHTKQVEKLTEQFDEKKMHGLVKEAFTYLSDNIDDLELGDMKMFKYGWRQGQQRHIEPLKQMIEQNGDPDGKIQKMIDARVPTEEKEWRRLYVLQAKTGNIGMDDFPSIKDRSEQALIMAQIVSNNPEVEKIWNKSMAEMDRLNQDNYDLFLKAPEFYRGTTTEELDNYLKSGNMGGEDNKYSYVSATMDRTQALGNAQMQVENKGLERVTIIYDGDSTREEAVPLQYNPMPIEHNWNFGDPIERADTPSAYNFYEEREIRMNENVPHPKIIGLNFGGLHGLNPEEAEKRFNELVEKYGSLTKNITYDEWASDIEPRNIHQTLTKVGSTKK